jgi:hypothetical protein
VSLLSALRAGVKVANKVTKSGKLQTTVVFRRTTTLNADGPSNPGSGFKLGAIAEAKTVQVRTPSGIEQATRVELLFLDVAAVVEATNGLGFIKDTDSITMPDGTTNAIMSTGGFVDAGTGHPIATEVVLG